MNLLADAKAADKPKAADEEKGLWGGENVRLQGRETRTASSSGEDRAKKLSPGFKSLKADDRGLDVRQVKRINSPARIPANGGEKGRRKRSARLTPSTNVLRKHHPNRGRKTGSTLCRRNCRGKVARSERGAWSWLTGTGAQSRKELEKTRTAPMAGNPNIKGKKRR